MTPTDIQAPSIARTMIQLKIEYPSDFFGLLLAADTGWGSVKTQQQLSQIDDVHKQTSKSLFSSIKMLLHNVVFKCSYIGHRFIDIIVI